MNRNKLSFKSGKLDVDYLTFNIQGTGDLGDLKLIKRIANYLFQAFGFNSTITRIIKGKWKSKDLNYNNINKFQVSFRQHQYDSKIKSFCVGTKIDFSGNNATQFYKIIQQQKFNWDIFDVQRTSLSRFDLNYLRELKTNEQNQDIEIFMEKYCHRIKIETKIQSANWR